MTVQQLIALSGVLSSGGEDVLLSYAAEHHYSRRVACPEGPRAVSFHPLLRQHGQAAQRSEVTVFERTTAP